VQVQPEQKDYLIFENLQRSISQSITYWSLKRMNTTCGESRGS